MKQNGYKYLVRKNVVIDSGIKSEADASLVIPFDNMQVSLKQGQDPSSVVIPTEQQVRTIIQNEVHVQSHKSFIGTASVATLQEARSKIADFNAGRDLALSGGTTYNKSAAFAGDVVLFDIANALNEEALVDTNKNMDLITSNNGDTAAVNALKVRVAANETKNTAQDTAIATKANTADVYGKTDVYNKAEVDSLQAVQDQEVENVEARISTLEQAERLEDKLWTGNLPIAPGGTVSINAVQDQNGDGFIFTSNKKMTLGIRKIGHAGVAHNILVGSSTPIHYVINGEDLNVRLGTNGVVTATKVGGSDPINSFEVYSLVEDKAARNIPVGYTRQETDAKFQLKVDNALMTASKSTTGAVNELKAYADQINLNVGSINNEIDNVKGSATGSGQHKDLDEFDGTTKDKTLASEQYVDGKIAGLSVPTDAHINALIDAKIAAALATTMHVEFDDSTTDDYKIGD